MADAKVQLSAKPAVSVFTDKASDTVPIWVNGVGIRQMTAANLETEIGGLTNNPMPDLDAVDGLASLNITTLAEGEIRWVTSEGAFYVWDEDLTPAQAASYTTVEPSNKPSPGVGNGYWIKQAAGDAIDTEPLP